MLTYRCLFSISSPIFSSRKRKLKVKIALPASVTYAHENEDNVEHEMDSPQSPDLLTRILQTDAGGKEASRLRHSGNNNIIRPDIIDCHTEHSRPFPVTKEQHGTNENSAKCDLSINGVTSSVSPTIDLTHGSLRLERATSNSEGEFSSRLKTRRLRKNGRTSGMRGAVNGFHKEESDDLCILSSVISNTENAFDGPVRPQNTSHSRVSPATSPKQRLFENGATNVNPLETFDRPVRPQDTSHSHYASATSPKKRLFQNGAGIMDPHETEATCNWRVSHFASSVNSPTNHHRSSEKPRPSVESLTRRKCFNGRFGNELLTRWTESVYSPPRHIRQVAPSSTRSTINSPPSSQNSSLRRKYHHKISNRRKQKLKSGRTSSTSADCDSVLVTKSNATVIPHRYESRTSFDTSGVADLQGFVPAGSLIDLTESPEPTWATGSMDLHPAMTRHNKHSPTRHYSRSKIYILIMKFVCP